MILRHKNPLELRQQIRTGNFTSMTSGLCSGYVQCNLVILEKEWAEDFYQFCKLNPKPCPIIYKSNPGEYQFSSLGEDIDIRTDISKYRVFKKGIMVSEQTDIKADWSRNFVSFLLGCSFSFEEALIANNLEIRNVSENVNVPMFITNIECAATEKFHGKMVVSMRPFKSFEVTKVQEITSQFPRVHGEPIHLGDPTKIGINNLSKPDFGDKVTIKADEIPVFWACGVTPQIAVQNASPPICITHSPGCMLVTDKLNAEIKN